MTHYLHFHPHLLDGIIIVSGAVVAAGLIWRFALRPWLRTRRHAIAYERDHAAHARPQRVTTLSEAKARIGSPTAPNAVWDERDTGRLDAAWQRELSGAHSNPTEPDDDRPTVLHTGSLLEPLPPAPHPRAWEQDRPVSTVGLPPWEAAYEAVVDEMYPDHEGCISCGAEVDHYLGCPDDPDPDYEAEAEYQGHHEPPLGATHRDGMTGHRDHESPAGDRSPESGSLSPRTHRRTPASVTAGRAPDLPGPDSQVRTDASALGWLGAKRRPSHQPAGKARRIWSGVLGALAPQNLPVPDRTVLPAPAPTAGLPVRDGQSDSAGQGCDVLTGAIHDGPPPGDDEAPTVSITVISVDAGTGPWQDDGWAAALPGYIAEHLPDGCQSTDQWLDSLFDPITGTAQLALTGASS